MSQDSKITVATDIDDKEQDHIKAGQFEDIINSMKVSNNKLNEVSFLLKQSISRTASHFKNSESCNTRVKYNFLAETMAFILILAVQFYYIKQFAYKNLC